MATGTLNFANMVFDLLWTNDSPNTAINPGVSIFDGSETLTNGYDGFLLFFNNPVNSEIRLMSQFLPCAYQNPDFAQLTGVSIGGDVLKGRWIGYYTDYVGIASYGSSGSSQSDTSCIPYKLYGYRYVSDQS